MVYKAERPPLKLSDQGYAYVVVTSHGLPLISFTSDSRGRGRKPGSAKSKLDAWYRTDDNGAKVQRGEYLVQKVTNYSVVDPETGQESPSVSEDLPHAAAHSAHSDLMEDSVQS